MQTAEIRRRYLQFFADRGHTVVPSASLVSPDPSLLFTVAGMVPFIPYLNGTVPAPYPRAVDVPEVHPHPRHRGGRPHRRGTAPSSRCSATGRSATTSSRTRSRWAWELLTTSEADGGLGFDPKDLWVTVFQDDDEAEAIWRDEVGLPAERIQRLGYADNYWMTGQPGPAGPDSEIFFDRGPAYGADGGPATGDDRYVEIWNLVFMQYAIANIRSKDDFDVVGELPNKNVDTGMGLERVAFLKQGVENIYEIDQIRPVIDAAAELSGRRVRRRPRGRRADARRRRPHPLRDDADARRRHAVQRGPRLRAAPPDAPLGPRDAPARRRRADLRRAVPGVPRRDERRLPGARCPSSAASSGSRTRRRRASSARSSAARPSSTSAIERHERAGGREVAGDTAFLLHDTYGFPIDLTLEVAEEAGLTVDRGAFDRAHAGAARPREGGREERKKTALADLSVYTRASARRARRRSSATTSSITESRVLGLIRDGVSVPSIALGDIAEVILAETTLYAESGGQDADQGEIVGPGYALEVLDVQRPVAGLVSHRVQVDPGRGRRRRRRATTSSTRSTAAARRRRTRRPT